MTHHNSEGFNQSSSHVGEIDDYFLRWASGNAVIQQPAFGGMTESTKRVLRYIRDNPGETTDEISQGLDVYSVKQYLHNFAAVGLLTATEPVHKAKGVEAQKARFTITQKGIDAIERTTVATAKPDPAERKYEPYVPPKYDHNDFRPGSMDAFKLPSLSFEGRKFPKGVAS